MRVNVQLKQADGDCGEPGEVCDRWLVSSERMGRRRNDEIRKAGKGDVKSCVYI